MEPIIGFLPEGQYDPSPVNPLGALVSRDIPGRVLQARDVEAKGIEALTPNAPQAMAQRKWARLEKAGAGADSLDFGVPSISSLRVAPFLQSRWSQTTIWDSGTSSDVACYNYYTPPWCGRQRQQLSQRLRSHGHVTVDALP